MHFPFFALSALLLLFSQASATEEIPVKHCKNPSAPTDIVAAVLFRQALVERAGRTTAPARVKKVVLSQADLVNVPV
ncbi:hypothetical protein NP233_g4482 [Leucocoprinus birnbaumii]|uniref:Uncharacterized protein n=1 Tax=Leucocoprinus birnbaumii TaxID=56174 RepID=A0AAD5YVG8_9AGAR|nr:hypothetical protein NP233_g4482 [Leucocoprinus birnbaumii]